VNAATVIFIATTGIKIMQVEMCHRDMLLKRQLIYVANQIGMLTGTYDLIIKETSVGVLTLVK
jgi:hypothetical protein